jgi:hypothetical protein
MEKEMKKEMEKEKEKEKKKEKEKESPLQEDARLVLRRPGDRAAQVPDTEEGRAGQAGLRRRARQQV